ncbi:MAG: TonB-dependent receptor [Candidatus Omnitrophota bacterium]
MKKIFIIVSAVLVFCSGVGIGFAAERSDVELERIVVTPVRMEQSDYEVSSNVTVIDSEDIGNSNCKYVADILKEEAGVNVSKYNSDKTARVDIRGFADTAVNNVLVLIDGRKVNSIDMSGPDWLQIPLESIERIEVLRGAASVMYGDNAVGGVINIITKKGAGEFSGKTGVKYASYGTHQEDVEFSGSRDNVSYYVYSKYYETNGYRVNSDLLSKDFNARLGYDLVGLALDVSAGWHEDDYGMPGGLDDQGELDRYGRRGSADASDFGSTKDRYIKVSTSLEPYLKNFGLGEISLDFFFRNRDAYSWFYYGGFPTATKYMINANGFSLKEAYDKEIFGRQFNLVTGVDYNDVEHVIRGSEWNTDDITIYKEGLGLYTYSECELFSEFFVNGGARYEKASYRFDQKAATALYTTSEPSESVFMGGLRYGYSENSSVYFNAQETFRFLATDEWYSTWTGLDANLKQQTGTQYEAGVKHSHKDFLKLSGTSYLIDIDNEIFLNPAVFPGYNQNYPKTRRRGVELGADLDLLKLRRMGFFDKLEIFANYTYGQAKFNGGVYDDNDIPMVPRQQINSGVNAGFLDGYHVSLTGKFTGDRYAINDVSNELPKVKNYYVLDGRLAYENDGFEIYTGVNNIFNEKYHDYVARATGGSTKKDYYPAPERSFEIGANYKF